MNPRTLLWVLILPVLALSCKDEPEQIPSYLDIQPFTVNAEGGAGWQKITEGWLYVNGEFLGAYSLPATVPVLAEGTSEVLVYPGVRKNGIAETPDIYPFLKRSETNMELVPGEVRSVSPATSYDDDAQLTWSFERGSFDYGAVIPLENRDNDPDNSFVITADSAFSGKSLLLEVDTAHALLEMATEAVNLPATYAQEVWMELHYRNDIPFYFYIIGNENGIEEKRAVYLFLARGDGSWNKIYLSLTDALLSFNNASGFRLDFLAILPSDAGGEFTQPVGHVRLDNIRLLHY